MKGNIVLGREGCLSVTLDGGITFDFLWSVGENKLHFAIFWKPLICAETPEHKTEFYLFFVGFFFEFYFTTRGPCCLQKQCQRSFSQVIPTLFLSHHIQHKKILILTVASKGQ